MVDTTNIEKKSLEAHVELCAERYKALEHRFDDVDKKFDEIEDLIKTVHGMVATMSEKRTDQLMGWGAAIITALLGVIGYLVTHYVL